MTTDLRLVATALVSGAVIFGLSRLVPGGATAVALPLVALAGWWLALGDTIRHLSRLGRAKRLDHARKPEGEVEIGAKLPLAPIAPPAELSDPPPLGAWQLRLRERVVRAEPELLLLTAPEGTVAVDLAQVTLQVDDERKRFLVDDEWRRLRATLAPTDAEDAPMAELRWLPPSHEVFVIGAPDWEEGGPRAVSYRERDRLPVFRGEGALLCDRSEREEDARSRYAALAWITAIVLCALIGAGQLFGRL